MSVKDPILKNRCSPKRGGHSRFEHSPLPFAKFWVGLALLILVIVLPLYAYKIYLIEGCTDFDVYYRAGERAKNQLWNHLYTLQDGASPFRYAPLFIPLFQILTRVSVPQAREVWYFLQVFWFGLGFYFIFLTLRLTLKQNSKLNAACITSLGFLFILRFCLDTFMIGQISSLIFLGFSVALYGWVLRKPGMTTLGLLPPTLLKIGPGFLFGIFMASRWRIQLRAAWTLMISMVALLLSYLVWVGSYSRGITLWKSWAKIVSSDSQYFDASHYGSQSLKSFLLRGVRFGWWLPQTANHIYLILAVLICMTVLLFWTLRRTPSFHGRALFFSLGLFPYIWLMPETFKYSLTPLAIPVVFLLSSKEKSSLTWFALLFGIFTLSLAGKDIVGDVLFFGSQNYSIPWIATLFLGTALFQLAWKNSSPAPIVHKLSRKFIASPPSTDDSYIFNSHEITADDWGISPAVNRAILQLAKLGIVRRVSLLAQSRFLQDGLAELIAIPQIELGLHFNLTFGEQFATHSPAQVLFHWMNPFENPQNKIQQVRKEFLSQIKNLESVGVRVQHLDGHQHIHLLPGLLDAIADLVKLAGIQRVRLPYDPSLWFSRKAPLLVLALLARPRLKHLGFRTSRFIYPNLGHFQDQRKFRKLLSENEDAEVIVHPADECDFEENGVSDPYTLGRVIEFRALRMLTRNVSRTQEKPL